MSMVVKNNMPAVSALNTLNKNAGALSHSLEHVATGMKLNSAADDNSGYAISERMRVQIRSLDQANQNTQNGSSMMKVAEGAVSSTIDLLKTLKEKVINAANDTNTDSDRQTIQKELDQSIDQINDNANITFNGKYLIDGSKNSVGKATYTALTNQSLSTATKATSLLTSLKGRTGANLDILASDKVTASFVLDAKTYTVSYDVATTSIQNIVDKMNESYLKDSPAAQAIYATYNNAVGAAADTFAASLASKAGINGGANGLYGLFAGAKEAFSLGSASAQSYMDNTSKTFYDTATGSPYVSTLSSKVAALGNTNDVNAALGVLQSAIDAATATRNAALVDLVAIKATVGETSTLGTAMSGNFVYTADGENAITFTAGASGAASQISGITISISDSNGKIKQSVNAVLDAFSETVRAENASEDNALVIQVGAKANQAIKLGLSDMRAEALGLKGSDGATLNISTQVKANAAINVLDSAIQKALEQQVKIGATNYRFEYTSKNLNTASENVQASESTYRDADMAKEMTEYTRNNVLLQASQSMLAQANQNSSDVLMLLR